MKEISINKRMLVIGGVVSVLALEALTSAGCKGGKYEVTIPDYSELLPTIKRAGGSTPVATPTKGVPTAVSTALEGKATPTATATATAVPTKEAPKPVATSTPKVEPTKVVVNPDKPQLSGFPAKVDAANVTAARGADAYGNFFTNKTGFGTEMVFGEDGVLKVGPEFPLDQFLALGKRVERYNPSNQHVATMEGETWPIREGGFTMINGNDMTIEFAGLDKNHSFRAVLGGDEVSHWIVAIRGLYPDAKTPSDRNRNVKLINHPAGNTMFDSYPLGAYISEGQYRQIIRDAFENFQNNGDAGARVVRTFTVDLNTGAYSVIAEEKSGAVKTLARNW